MANTNIVGLVTLEYTWKFFDVTYYDPLNANPEANLEAGTAATASADAYFGDDGTVTDFPNVNANMTVTSDSLNTVQITGPTSGVLLYTAEQTAVAPTTDNIDVITASTNVSSVVAFSGVGAQTGPIQTRSKGPRTSGSGATGGFMSAVIEGSEGLISLVHNMTSAWTNVGAVWNAVSSIWSVLRLSA
jgi:hypothetical protein